MLKGLRFDTRDVKPKIYDVAVLSGVVTAIFAFFGWMASRGLEFADVPFLASLPAPFSSVSWLTSAILVLYFFLVLVCLIRAFVRQVGYNPYSYNTIYYAGFSIFVFILLVVFVVLGRSFGQEIEQMGVPSVGFGLWSVVSTLSATGHVFLLITAPFILVFSLLLCISNISLIRHEGFRPVNVVGIILSVMLVGGMLFLFLFNQYAYGSMEEVRLHDLVGNVGAALYLYIECTLLGTMIANALVVRYEPDPDKDYLVILGCGLMADGSPTPLLRGRIERGLEFYRRQKAETGKELIFVASGGQGSDEVISEGESIKRYLMEQGIPESQILVEGKSASTFQNMKFSRQVILDHEGLALASAPGTAAAGTDAAAVGTDAESTRAAAGTDAESTMLLSTEELRTRADDQRRCRIVFSTTNYHVFRSGLHARRNKMRAQGVGAPTKWYFWPNAAVREFVGLLTEHRLKQALIIGGLAAIYFLVTWLSYYQ